MTDRESLLRRKRELFKEADALDDSIVSITRKILELDRLINTVEAMQREKMSQAASNGQLKDHD